MVKISNNFVPVEVLCHMHFKCKVINVAVKAEKEVSRQENEMQLLLCRLWLDGGFVRILQIFHKL